MVDVGRARSVDDGGCVQDHPTRRIRNVALLGHSGAGKTTLAEAMLYRAGVTTRAGSVPDGTTVTDTDPEEIARQMTISLAVAPFDWATPDGTTYKVNLIDTPGYPDFAADVDAALAVADLAIIVVSAVDGVELGTELAWRRCERRNIPRMFFVSREDKHRADFRTVLDQLRSRFGSACVPLELPLGEDERLHGIADVLSERALEYDSDGSHHDEGLPSDVADEEHQLHEQLVEEIVAGDDDQLERYLSGEVPTTDALERTLAREVLDLVEFPVLCGSGTTLVGVDRLADLICELGPSPADRPSTVIAGDTTVDVVADPDGDPLIHVFKSVADQYVGQLSLFKVLSGTLHDDTHLVDTATGTDQRLHGLVHLRGTEQHPAARIVAGDLGAIPKLTVATTSSTLAPAGRPVRLPTTPPPAAVYGVSLHPRSRSDDDKLSPALKRLAAEDPALQVEFDEDVRQTILRGTGDIHVAVALARLERRFGVHVDTGEVNVPYRETLTTTAEAQGRVKKQSGGHGQYAVVDLRVAPLPRGGGLEFVDSIVGGAIPKNYVAAVRKGIEQAMATGGAHGFPVVDVRVECYDGKTHSVDSSEMAFKTAAAIGFRQAVAAAEPVLLEPIQRLTVTVPSELQGEVLGDISARRGKVVASDTDGDGSQVITAEVPAAELRRYALEVRAITGGRATFEVRHDHYDVVPSHLVAAATAQTAGVGADAS